MERYTVKVDASVRGKEQLFACFTDTIFLGESGIPGWDQFYDLLFYRLSDSDIFINVINHDLSGLSADEIATYAKVIASVQSEVPGKLRLT